MASGRPPARPFFSPRCAATPPRAAPESSAARRAVRDRRPAVGAPRRGGAHREFQLAACAAARRAGRVDAARPDGRRDQRRRSGPALRASSLRRATRERRDLVRAHRARARGADSRRRPLVVDRRRAAPECAAFDRGRRPGQAAWSCARMAGKSCTRMPTKTRVSPDRLRLTQPDLEVRIAVLQRQ